MTGALVAVVIVLVVIVLYIAAEAEREKDAVIIKAEDDRIAADNISQAAKIITQTSGGMFPRTLSTLTDLSANQSKTIVFLLPMEILKAMGRSVYRARVLAPRSAPVYHG